MQKKIITLFAVLLTAFSYAQTYEVGVMVGASNYVGDTGSTTFIRPADVGFGFIAKWNRSRRHSFRFSAAYIPISGNDLDGSDPLRQERGYKFENSVKEFSLGLEFTFVEWDLHEGTKQMTPYLYTGITGINYGALARTTDGDFKAFENPWTMAIPIVLGIKTNLGRHIVASFELGARYAFTDNIDGSNPEDLTDGLPINLNFGNLNTNDWYFFNALTLTYTFGRRPCYCNF